MAEPAYRLYDPGAYHSDPEDKQWTQKHEEAGHSVYFSPTPRKRDTFGKLETYMKAVAQLSTEKPRWLKIIEHANSLADELEIPREQFYATALIEFIEKKENQRITEELNEAYKNIDQEEEAAFLNHLVRHYDPRLADE